MKFFFYIVIKDNSSCVLIFSIPSLVYYLKCNFFFLKYWIYQIFYLKKGVFFKKKKVMLYLNNDRKTKGSFHELLK